MGAGHPHPPRTWECRPDCGACCAFAAIPEALWKRMQHLTVRRVLRTWTVKTKEGERVVFPRTEDGFCPFLSVEKRCVIYADRPDLCRLFGQVPEFECPYIFPDGSPVPEDQFNERWKAIQEQIDERTNRMFKLDGRIRCRSL